MLHRDIGVVIGDPQIVNAHDVLMLETRNDLVFLEEPVEPDESFGHVGDLAENLEDDQRPGAFALREVDLAHAAAAYLLDAAVTSDDDRAEPVALREIRM